MINTEIINFLSEVDTNVFLFFNGIHSPFWDYFMSAFTGKIIWVPMYATILYILLINFHIVNGYRGGSYGFPSCHAANSFGLAMYVVFLFRKRWLSVFIITWAVLNCYTRIYLGVHYPGDLIVGGIIGGFGGWLFCTIAHKIASYLQKPSRVRRNTIRQTSVTMYVGFLTVLGIIIYSTIKSW